MIGKVVVDKAAAATGTVRRQRSLCQAVATAIDEIPGEGEVTRLAGFPVPLDQRGFHLGMPTNAVDGLAAGRSRRSDPRIRTQPTIDRRVRCCGAASPDERSDSGPAAQSAPASLSAACQASASSHLYTSVSRKGSCPGTGSAAALPRNHRRSVTTWAGRRTRRAPAVGRSGPTRFAVVDCGRLVTLGSRI